MPALDWLTDWQARALRRGRVPAMTIEQLIMLRVLLQSEQTMVAKVAGFGGFIGLVKEFQHPDWGDMAESMGQIGADLARERERAKENIGKARGAVDQLIAFNAAFDNGGPSDASGQSSGAKDGQQSQGQQQPSPAEKPANPQ